MIKQKLGDFIVIGGGGFGAASSQGLIEQYILDQAGKKRPRICFVPTASGDNAAYVKAFYDQCDALDCDACDLLFFSRTSDVREVLLSSDIIYVGGGNTMSMLGVFSAWGLDQVLREAHQMGILLSGVSAGMICWFHSGITDSWASNYELMDCLGYLPGCACPHYDTEAQRRPLVHDLIHQHAIKQCVAIEDGAAIHYRGKDMAHALSFQKDKKAYCVFQDGGQVIEQSYDMLQL